MSVIIRRKGIDVSEYQGDINWPVVKDNIDFVIIRAGFGKNNIDKQFIKNATECAKYGIPFGVYWFSYAYNEEMAKAEADYVCNAVKGMKLQYPICFDYEYDSDNWAQIVGVTVDNALREKIAISFMNRVEERGYYASLYSNIDYLNRGFSALISRYDLWVAKWGDSPPTMQYGMWQYTSKGALPGIIGAVDMNYAYKDYPEIIKNMNNNNNAMNEIDKIKIEMWKKYYGLALEVIQGKWGNGEARKTKLKNAGYDYNLVQSIVNIIA